MNDRREEALEKARDELAEIDRSRVIVRAVSQLEQAEKNLRKEIESFRDWYSLHFPELEREIEDDEQLLEVLSGGAERDELDAFESLAEDSKGVKLPGKDIEMIEKTVEKLSRDREYRDELEDYIAEMCEEEMPNVSELLNPVLAAKLVSLAGGLDDLAKSPASTIQMLGAESALFRHLSGEGSAPKHGVLFEHRFVRTLPEDERGKMARFLANKTAIA
ncbi:MAG: ATP-binding protein, partial [Candidatus Nanohaloarchaea archaeon]